MDWSSATGNPLEDFKQARDAMGEAGLPPRPPLIISSDSLAICKRLISRHGSARAVLEAYFRDPWTERENVLYALSFYGADVEAAPSPETDTNLRVLRPPQ